MGKVVAGGLAPLSRRPDNSAFKQQRLPAWSPALTHTSVLPTLYTLALLCFLIGTGLILTTQHTQQLKVDYTEAGSCGRCYELRKHSINAGTPCSCSINLTLPENFTGDVFFYYGLRNFHQNLRRYMDSRDDAQMVGREKNLKNPTSYCDPFSRDKNGVPIAPCGAVANSMFNDSFSVWYHGAEGSSVAVPLHRKGIAWYTDKNVKFRNPHAADKNLTQLFQGTARPLYWQRPVYDLDPSDSNNNGFINEDLIVWMREAAFPNFKKLYGILNRNGDPFTHGLPSGEYTVNIIYNFPVEYFQGRKEVVFSTVSWFGGQNNFLPVAYLVTGGLNLLTAIALTTVYLKVGRNGRNMEE